MFEREFAIGAVLRIAPDAAAGLLGSPVRLRYQACDAKLCYLPTTVQSSWTVQVGAASKARASHKARCSQGFASGPGKQPPASAAATAGPGAPGQLRRCRHRRCRTPRRFTIAGTTAGYLVAPTSCQFIRDAENGIVEKGWFEGRGPLAILFSSSSAASRST